eukprot:417370_1
MSLIQLPTVVLYHDEQDLKYRDICDTLKRTFLDVSTVSNELPQDRNTPFYCIIFTQKELLTCLHHYRKAVPIGYKLFLRYLQSTKNQSRDTKSKHTLSYLMDITQKLFQKLTLCTSGIHNDSKNDIKTVCSVLSSSFDGNFTDSITHLLETTIGSQKHIAAVSSNGRCQIVTPRWLYDSYINGKIMRESMYCPPLFCGFFISVTGLRSTEREQIKVFVTQYGGSYCQGLSQQCTHLIAKDLSNNEKCQAAIKWKIPILNKQWFYDHLKTKGCVDPKQYTLSTNPTPMKTLTEQFEEGKHVEEDLDMDVDIGEDTELREVIQMIQDHDDQKSKKNDPSQSDIIDEEEIGFEDLCYMENYVVLLLCLEAQLKKEAIELLRRGKGTALTVYHWMGTHVVTSSLDDMKKIYPQCFEHCTVVSIDWLRHCDHTQSIIDCNKYNLLIHPPKKSTKESLSLPMSQASVTNDESSQYESYITDCLSMNASCLINAKVFENMTFNVHKLSLNEQRKVCKLIAAGNGKTVRSGSDFSYLVCGVISTVEFETNHFEEIECVSVIWIVECLRQGQLLNVTDCISFLPELLNTAQSNTLFTDIHICLSQFDNKRFERYRIQSALRDTNAMYHRSFHPTRCDVLICKHCKGAKYDCAKEQNIPIVNWLWLVDSIRNGKQMPWNEYTLSPQTMDTPQVVPQKENTKGKTRKHNRKQSSILGDVFGENIQNALTNMRGEDDLCSPALASAVPPIEIDIDDALDDITNCSTIIEGIDHMSPIPRLAKNDTNIVMYCHRSLDKNKRNLMAYLVSNYGFETAKSLNKRVTHYVIDTELTDKTQEMRRVKEREKEGTLHVVTSKWLQLKRKEFEGDDKYKYKNSITRARKRKYQDLEFTESNYFDEETVNDEITQFEYDKDVLSAMNTKSKKKKNPNKRRKKNNNGDIRKHIKITHKIGVLLTGICGDKKVQYEAIVNDLNGVVLSESNYAQIDEDEKDESVNFKYIVAHKLVRSEKIIIGIIRRKIIVKPSYLDGCKKAKKWLPPEPHCWMNDEELIRHIPSNGGEAKKLQNNEPLKSKVDLIQAIRSWRQIEIETTRFYEKNIFVWLPQERINTYTRMLRAIKVRLYMIKDGDDDIETQLQDIANTCEGKMDEVYLANQDEIKQIARSVCKSNKNKEYKVVFKSMMKKLTLIAKFWATKHKVACYDSDYLLDWTLEEQVFKNSNVNKKDYKFAIRD